MKINHKRLLASFLSFLMLFAVVFHTSNSAHAWWGIMDASTDPPNLIENALSYAEQVMTYEEQYGNDLEQWAVQEAVNAVKKAAMSAVQKKLLSSSKSKLITNYGKYLYTAPMQQTSVQMNAYFNSMTGGTASSANYEGVGGGSNYSAYLVAQAKGSINGVNMQVNITNVVSDPTQPFSSGNMQGIMSLLECSNNPYCVSIASQSKYNQLLDQNQTIAKSQSSDGFMPTEQNGQITSPASMAANLATSASQMGINAIVDAMNNDSSSEDIISAGEDYVSQLTDSVGQAGEDYTSQAIDQASASIGYDLPPFNSATN